MTLPAVPDPHPVPATVTQLPLRPIAAYPVTAPPQVSLGDAGRVVQEALAIFTEMGDRLAAVLRQPYPCALCPTDMAGWPEWQMRRHFLQHPLRDRARVVGWARAVTQW